MKNGIIVIDKEPGMTSQTAVSKVRRLFGGVKAGHTGTLDPMATGVLPVMLGNATRAGEFLLSSVKEYEAVLRLGMTTDTEDVTGKVLSECAAIPEEDAVQSAVSRFRGEILQTPPMYSALKVGGQKLADVARRGITVEREARPVTVFRLDAEKIDAQNYRLFVVCSKGTYIRTLCADIGQALGCGGCMAALRRGEAGGFRLCDAVTVTALAAMTEEERVSRVIPVSRVFDRFPRVTLSAFFAHLARAGCSVSLRKIASDLPGDADLSVGTRVALYDGGGFFALAEVTEDNEQLPGTGPALKPIRQFPEA